MCSNESTFCLLNRGGEFRKPSFFGNQKSQDVHIKIKLQRIKINKAKIVVGAFLYEKKTVYIISTENCYLKNGKFQISCAINYHLK